MSEALDELKNFNALEDLFWKMEKIWWDTSEKDNSKWKEKNVLWKKLWADSFTTKEQNDILWLLKDWDIDVISNKKELNDTLNSKIKTNIENDINTRLGNNKCKEEIKDIQTLMLQNVSNIEDPKAKLKEYSKIKWILDSLVSKEIAEMQASSDKFKKDLKEAIINAEASQESFTETIKNIINSHRTEKQKWERIWSVNLRKENEAKEAAERKIFEMTWWNSNWGGWSQKKS